MLLIEHATVILIICSGLARGRTSRSATNYRNNAGRLCDRVRLRNSNERNMVVAWHRVWCRTPSHYWLMDTYRGNNRHLFRGVANFLPTWRSMDQRAACRSGCLTRFDRAGALVLGCSTLRLEAHRCLHGKTLAVPSFELPIRKKEEPVSPKVGHTPPEIAFSTARYGVARKWIIWETAHIESPQASAARLGKMYE